MIEAAACGRLAPVNQLYYGDNLTVLRDRARFPDACVDLIYLRGGGGDKRGMEDGRADPPFNSKRDYNLLFKSPKIVAGENGYSAAQIEAFEDRGGGRDSWRLVGGREWHWSPDVTEREYDEVLKGPNSDVGKMMKALVEFLGRNDRGGGGDSRRLAGGRATAYLVMMANRLLELHRALKPTGSLYLHCDPTASLSK